MQRSIERRIRRAIATAALLVASSPAHAFIEAAPIVNPTTGNDSTPPSTGRTR
jgi:hypothetical protein